MTKLKAMRQKVGITQAQLADAARISRPFLLEIENGRRGTKRPTWERLAEILGCDVSDIYHDIHDLQATKEREDDMRKFHRYYCPERPPMPGTIPRGVVRIEYAEDGFMIDDEGHSRKAWGFVEYDRILTPKEIADYELDPEDHE